MEMIWGPRFLSDDRVGTGLVRGMGAFLVCIYYLEDAVAEYADDSETVLNCR